MNVLVDGGVYQWSGNGGIARILSETLPRMCALDPELAIVLFTVGEISQAPPSSDGVRWVQAPNLSAIMRPGRLFNRRVTPFFQDLLTRALVGRERDSIWHPSYYSLPWPQSRNPYVLTVHDTIYELFPDLFSRDCDHEFRRKKRKCIERADILLCISETTAQDVAEIYGVHRSRIRVAPLGYGEVFDIKPAVAADGRKPYLLYVGNRGGYKNFEPTLRAYAVWQKRQDVDLYVVGPEWEPSEKALLETLGISESVTLWPRPSDEKLRELYHGAVALVYPSLYEGFGLPLLEAIACRCPIVASRIPSTVEVAKDYPVYFEPKSTDDLLAAFSRVLFEGRSAEKDRTATAVLSRYSWNQTARLTLEAYSAVARQ